MIKPDTVTAICSTIIATMALLVAVWSSVQVRVHNELSVQPLLDIEFADDSDNESAGFIITNLGLGPARLVSSEIFVDGQAMPDLGYGGVKATLSYLDLDRDEVIFTGLSGDMVIAAGERVALITIARPHYYAHIDSVLPMRDSLSLTLKYKSMYNIEDTAIYRRKR